MNPELDLVLERVVDVPPDLVWRAWTTPEQLVRWFAPAPWRTVECEIDLKPGGTFRTVMESPDGRRFPNAGCYLEVVPGRRLTWTTALLPGFRPASPPVAGAFAFTAVLALEPAGAGTRYTATALHADSAARGQHEAMGFHHGWGAVLDQLVALVRAPGPAGAPGG